MKLKALIVGLLALVAASASAQLNITNEYTSASTSSTVTVTWTTNNPASSSVKYGQNGLQYQTQTVPALVTSHSVTIKLLQPGPVYSYAAYSIDGSGNIAQGTTQFVALCGQATEPVAGTVNPFYEGGPYVMSFNRQSAASGVTPTICGQPMQETVSGVLNDFGSFSNNAGDSLKVIPGPGSWTVAVTDKGNLSPISIVSPLSQVTQDVSDQLKAAAALAGLTGCISNVLTARSWPPACAGGGGGGPLLQTNGVSNFLQSILNLQDGPNIHIVNTSGGNVQFTVTGIPTPLDVQTNSSDNASQTLLNFTNSSTITFTNPSGGVETAACNLATSSSFGCVQPDNTSITISGGILHGANQQIIQVNGTPITTESPANFQNTATVTWSNPSAGNIQATATGGGGGTQTVIEVNSIPTTPVSPVNFNNTTPSAPSGDLRVNWQQDLSGNVSGYVVPGPPGIETIIKYPTTGNFITIYPNSASITSDPTGGSSIFANGVSSSGFFVYACSGLLCNLAPHFSANFTNFSLPAGVSPSNVVAIWADSVNSVGITNGVLPNGGANVSSLSCGDGTHGSGALFATGNPPVTPYATQEVTSAIPGAGGTNIPSMTCNAILGATSSNGGILVNLNAIRLFVQLNITPPTPDNNLFIAPPLYYNTDLNQLGVNTVDLPSGNMISFPFVNLPIAPSTPNAIRLVTGTSDCLHTGTGNSLCYSDGSNWSLFSLGGSAVYSLTNTDGSLTFSPTTGNVVGSINLANANTWTGIQTFSNGISAGGITDSLITGTTQCIHANSSGVLSGTGTDCGSGGGTTYINVVASSTADTTVATINTKCNGGQTYWASEPLSLATGGTIGSGCNVMFVKGGVWTIASGQTVTFANPIQENDGPSQHFAGSGTVVYAASQQALPEWMGAVNDWNGSTGTDNAASINATIAALTTGGSVRFQGSKCYKTASVINVHISGISLLGSPTGLLDMATVITGLNSCIITTSATATILDIAGSSTSSHVHNTLVKDIQFARSVLPTGGASIGISNTHATGTVFKNTRSDDSYLDFYNSDTGNTNISDSFALWGANGITESTGTYCGFCIDDVAGASNASIVINNSQGASTGLTGIDSRALQLEGGLISDVIVNQFQAFQTAHGIYISTTASSAFHADDVHFTDSILDTLYTDAIYVNGVGNAATPGIEFKGGWANTTAGSYMVDLESSYGVRISDMQLGPNGGGTTALFYLHGGGIHQLTGNTTFGGFGVVYTNNGAALTVDGSIDNSITGNVFNNNPNGPITNVVFKNTSTNNTFISNVIQGGPTSSTGISLDSTSSHNRYVNLNAIVGYTTSINDSGTDNQLTTGTSAFSGLTGGTNTSAAMVVGSGASLGPTGTGTIQATNIASTITAGTNVTVTGSGTTASPYNISSSGGGTGGWNGTLHYTANHTLSSGDCQAALVFNCTSACALTLPNPQPTTTCSVLVQSIGTTTATITLGSSMTYNGGSSVPVLVNFALLPIMSDTATSTNYTAGTPLVAGSNVTLTPAANGVTIASTGGGGGGAITNLCSTVSLTNATCSSGKIVVTNGSSSFTVSSIPGTYLSMQMKGNFFFSSTSDQLILVTYNGDTGTHYGTTQFYAFSGGTGQPNSGTIAADAANKLGGTGSAAISGYSEWCKLEWIDYANTVAGKAYTGDCSNTQTSNLQFIRLQEGTWNDGSNSAITSIKFASNTGTFATNTYIALYGLN